MVDFDAGSDGVGEAVRRTLELYAGWTRETTLADMRSGFGALHAEPAASGQPIEVAGMPGLRFGDAEASATVLFFHGGGYQVGSSRSHAGLMARLAESGGAQVIGFDYRLAPEAKFPAAVEDALAAWRWLVSTGIEPARVAFAGDSAGGGLAVATMLAARDGGLPLPSGAALMSPWLDMGASGASYADPAVADPLTRTDAIRAMARAYLGRDGNALDPLASPISAELHGLPPILIHVGAREVVLDDSRRFAERVAEVGGAIELRIWPEMIHVFQIYPEIAAGHASIAEIAAFINRTIRG